MNFTRRNVLRASFVSGGIAASGPLISACAEAKSPTRFKVNFTTDQWKDRLSPSEMYVLRGEGTERPFSSPLNKEKRDGTFVCAGCNQKLFSSETKFESGTGWPSFWQPLKGATGTSTDYKLGYPRKEVHCSRCGGHLGHVFDDGPKPTGKRYCMNGVAMDFVAKGKAFPPLVVSS